MDYGLFLLLSGLLSGFVIGVVVRTWTSRRHPPADVTHALEGVIHAFYQIKRAVEWAPTKKMRGLATGKTYSVPMSPDWGRFVRAVNDLALSLRGGPLRAEMGGHDPEVDFKPEKRGI